MPACDPLPATTDSPVTRAAALNNIDHATLRVDASRGHGRADLATSAITFPAEFRHVQARFPIVFAQGADGVFHPLALFGLQQGQNLFLDARGWEPGYVPLAVRRQPFLIGGGAEPTIHIDLDDPRVNTESGEALFRAHGGTTEFLDQASALLHALHTGLATVPAFARALDAYRLLEPLALDVQLGDAGRVRLTGMHTVDEARLRALDAGALAQLHAAGHLEALYMAIASLSNLDTLVARARRHVG